MTSISDYDVSSSFRASVVKSQLITPEGSSEEVRVIQLDIDVSDFNFELGQSILVRAPGSPELGGVDRLRLYSIAGLSGTDSGHGARLELYVKRCFYIDEFNGERYDGVVSNFLCDLEPGDEVDVSGPFGVPFNVPSDRSANLIMIGMGTGIAPFRAFITKIYREESRWGGQVRLFYGARTGLELAYLNKHLTDLSNYYHEETFRAFEAVCTWPHQTSKIPLEEPLKQNSSEVWKLLNDSRTYIYVAGVDKLARLLDEVFSGMAGSEEAWRTKREELIEAGRWQELIY